jgi:hypothetical protein
MLKMDRRSFVKGVGAACCLLGLPFKSKAEKYPDPSGAIWIYPVENQYIDTKTKRLPVKNTNEKITVLTGGQESKWVVIDGKHFLKNRHDAFSAALHILGMLSNKEYTVEELRKTTLKTDPNIKRFTVGHVGKDFKVCMVLMHNPNYALLEEDEIGESNWLHIYCTNMTEDCEIVKEKHYVIVTRGDQ